MQNYKSKLKIFVIFSIFFFGLFGLAKTSWAACTGSSPTWTCSSDYASINNLINGGSPAGFTAGDTINVSSGSSSWGSNTLTITRGMKLVGAGINTTTITSTLGNYTCEIDFSPNSTARANDEAFEVSGFTFNMGGGGGSAICLSNAGTTAEMSKIKIYSNKFLHNTAGSGLVSISGNFFGVAYNNTFDSTQICFRAHGANASSIDGMGSWNTLSAIPGAEPAKNFYWEDNTFQGNSAFFYHEMGGGPLLGIIILILLPVIMRIFLTCMAVSLEPAQQCS